jgi:DNA-binding transcriptional ArsR family regulator
MPTLHVTADDLAKLRFAYRPLLEIPFSYRVLINPEYQFPHLRWVEEAKRVLHDIELPYLEALVPPRGFFPDFLTPTPLTNGTDIERDLKELIATPDSVIRQQVQWLIQDVGESEMRMFFLAHPHEAVQGLVEELRRYWCRTLEQSWPRMVGILDGDILYRGRLLALEGPEALLPDLHPSITYQNSEINALILAPILPAAHCPLEVSLYGEGIQLVPTIFNVAGRMWKVTPEWHPMIGYGARGAGHYGRETLASKPLEQALGAARARVLQTLTIPATTGEVAYKARISAGTASAHLSRLTRAGLVEPHRSGKRVYYHLTSRGTELIALFERIH